MKRISAADYQAMKNAFPAKRKVPRKQQESIDQKAHVKALNDLNIGFFYRVKNMGTFDHIRKVYRKNNELVAIPDICGYLTSGQAAYIEVKRVLNVEKKKKLIFKVIITDEQKKFLLDAHRSNCLAGVAFNFYDCLSIVMNDPQRYPRHPRTYAFLPKDELESYAEEYKTLKSDHALNRSDVITAEVIWPRKPK